jgi:hypothetical protein
MNDDNDDMNQNECSENGGEYRDDASGLMVAKKLLQKKNYIYLYLEPESVRHWPRHKTKWVIKKYDIFI